MQFCIKENGEEYLSLARRLPALGEDERERLSVLQTKFSACIRKLMKDSSVESLPADEWHTLCDARSWAKSILFQALCIKELNPRTKKRFNKSLAFLDKHNPLAQEHTHAPSTANTAMAMA